MAQRAGGGVAAVGEELLERGATARYLAQLDLGVAFLDSVVLTSYLSVELLEAGTRHEDLAAQLDGIIERPCPADGLELGRNICHLADVLRDVFARGAVPAGGCAGEDAVMVGERDGGAVDLELAAIAQGSSSGLARALQPGAELVEIHGVVERVHAHRVFDAGKRRACRAAHGAGGGIVCRQQGEALLEVAQLALE